MALLEMAGEQRKAGEQAEQVGDGHPLMAEMADETGNADPGLEAGEQHLVQADGDQAGQRDMERGMVKERHAKQGQGEQDEIDGNAADSRQVASRKGG